MRHAYDEFEEGQRVLVCCPMGDARGWRWGTVVDTGVGGERVGIRYWDNGQVWHEPVRNVYSELDGLAQIFLESVEGES
ncbi:MAG: hypothetical protein L0Z62_50485 [Gemmataceae bacterium]|nr:hypothetical protein [Gemmataceae bacterium]